MKFLLLILTALLAVPTHSIAADAVKIDIYLAGHLEQSISFLGANSTVKFSPTGLPNTTLVLRLIAPEPLIVDIKEITTDGRIAEAIGRVKLVRPGSSFDLSEVKGAKFSNSYVLVRPY